MSTVEMIATFTQRPLYSIKHGELGLDPKRIEESPERHSESQEAGLRPAAVFTRWVIMLRHDESLLCYVFARLIGIILAAGLDVGHL